MPKVGDQGILGCRSLFHPAHWVLQQFHKHSHSRQLATQTELAHHYIQYALATLSVFFFNFYIERVFQSTAQPHQSTKMALERAASHIKVTHPPCLFQLPPWENVNRVSNSNFRVCE